MAKRIKRTKRHTKKIESPFKDYWEKKNFYILYLGLGILIIGYYLMAQPPYDSFLSLSLSPIVLLIGYLVVIPLAILYKGKNNSKENGDNVSS